MNYRNTAEVLAARDADEDGVPQVLPESAGRHGPYPELRQCAHAGAEVAELVQVLRDAHRDGMAWSDMAVLYRTNYQAKGLETALQRAQIPLASGLSGQQRDALFASGDTLKLVSMASSKGLEFPLVVIPGIGQLPNPNVEEVHDARLLYVAMTRALDRLVLLSSQRNDFSQRIATAIAHAREGLQGMG